jgi:branched-chain amino acid transport system substrate-binding protein
VFSASASTAAQTQAFANFVKAKGWKRVAALTSTDASGQDGWESLQSAIGATHGAVTVADHETFAPTDVSVNSQLAKIQSTHPQALFVWTTGTPLSTALHGLQQLGITKLPVMTTNGNASYAEMKKLSNVLPTQLYFPGGPFQLEPSQVTGPEKQAVTSFQTAMKAQGSVVPDEGNALAWDPGMILINALKKLGVKASSSQIKTYISKLPSYVGVDGTYDFTSPTVAPDNRGIGVNAILISQWNKSKSTWTRVSGSGGKTLER